MDKYIKYSDIPFCKIELEERCHNDRWTEIHEVAYKTEIDRIPAADVAPVRHGHWEYHLMPYVVKCSACHERIPVGKNEWNYCPNCGAVMDKDGDG